MDLNRNFNNGFSSNFDLDLNRDFDNDFNRDFHPMQILVPALSGWPLVGISKHRRENSTLLAYNQMPQPQLGPNVQALRRGL